MPPFVGAALAVAGTVLQVTFANPLIEPSLIGISGAAGVSAIAWGSLATGVMAVAASIPSLNQGRSLTSWRLRCSWRPRSRVRIAQALLQRPSVLFADEPDAALDRAASHARFAMLAASDETVVAVTHDIDLAKRCASHVIGLRAGRIAFQRPAAEVSVEDCEALWS